MVGCVWDVVGHQPGPLQAAEDHHPALLTLQAPATWEDGGGGGGGGTVIAVLMAV